MTTCKCGDGMGNTGLPSCVAQISYGVGIIMTPTYASDGTLNQIDLTDTLDSAYVTAAINNADASQRWYPVMNMKNVENKISTPEFEEFDDKTKVEVFDGIRTFKVVVPGAPPHLVGKLKTAACEQMSYFIVGKNGELQGSDFVDGFLTPFKISKGSFVAQYEFPTPKTTGKIMLEFTIDFSEQDENVSYISASEFSNYSFFTINGLIDAKITVVSTGVTTAVLKVTTEYGSALTKGPVEGLLAADFVGNTGTPSNVYDVTDASDLAVTVVEAPAGTYTLTYPTESVSDVLRFRIKRNGILVPDATGTIV